MIQLSVESKEWRRFIADHEDSVAFHHPSWTLLLAECYGFRPFALAFAGDDGSMRAGLPVLEIKQFGRRRWVSQPFSDVSPPLVAHEDAARFAVALEAAVREAGVRRLEVRGDFSGVDRGFDPPFVTHEVQLERDEAAVRARFKRHVRKNLRTAERAGIVVRRGETESDLTERFYRLQLETRRRLGVPVQPRRWYQLLWRRILEPGLGFLLLADRGGSTIAGGVFLVWNGVVTAKFSASDASAWSVRPNNAIFWEAIRSGCASGHRVFHFGRTDLRDEQLRWFKLGWGAVERPLGDTVFGAPSTNGARTGTGVARAVIRHSPIVVTRALGEVFYRYAA